ncbi:MAG: hypothetical protein H6716_22230 [Polyangiaceae bacterium]|nr:hypothetical protein [Polyangiaceae bacterium]
MGTTVCGDTGPTCECKGAGGVGGAAGNTGAAGSAGTAGGGAAGGSAGSGGAAGSAAAAGVGGVGGTDECGNAYRIDCTSDDPCVGLKDGGCDSTCANDLAFVVYFYPALIHLPAAVQDASCCSPVVRRYTIYSSPLSPSSVTFRVDPPWKLVNGSAAGVECGAEGVQCTWLPGTLPVVVYTEDPNAPDAYVSLEEGSGCP